MKLRLMRKTFSPVFLCVCAAYECGRDEKDESKNPLEPLKVNDAHIHRYSAQIILFFVVVVII